ALCTCLPKSLSPELRRGDLGVHSSGGSAAAPLCCRLPGVEEPGLKQTLTRTVWINRHIKGQETLSIRGQKPLLSRTHRTFNEVASWISRRPWAGDHPRRRGSSASTDHLLAQRAQGIARDRPAWHAGSEGGSGSRMED